MSRVLAECALVCHPDTPCEALAALGVRIASSRAGGWDVEFVMVGDPARLSLPAPTGPVQTDGLWHTTCFEMFAALEGDSYTEFNFSPSCAWAAYHFDHYRTGMTPMAISAPQISIAVGSERIALTTRLAPDTLPWDEVHALGLSAVIEERSGAVSYWALAHQPGKPDFHHRDCFTLRLPPLSGA